MTEPLDMAAVRWRFTKIVKCNRITSCRAAFPSLSHNYGPHPGFVGRNYSNCRVVLLAQNPGHASQSSHGPGEVKMYKLWRAAARSRCTKEFDEVMRHIAEYMTTWPVFQRLKLTQRFGLGLEDVAYFNALKCKTTRNKKPSKALYRECAKQTTVPQMEVLAPRFVLCLGKDIYNSTLSHILSLNIPCDWIYHPSGEHYFPEKQKSRVQEAAAKLRRALKDTGRKP
jgi:hypothetical protein